MRRETRQLWRALALIFVSGCSAGGLGLSGGSIPSGRAVTGTAVLPSQQPLSAGAVTVTTLAAQTPVGSGSTDGSGKFQLSDIPTDKDLVFAIRRPGGTTILKVVVTKAQLGANPGQPLDLGKVTAATTLVCEAVEQEAHHLPDDASQFAGTQGPRLKQQLDGEGQTEGDQDHEINDDSFRHDQAFGLVERTTDQELDDLSHAMNPANAQIAFNGVTGYIVFFRHQSLTVSTVQQTDLINGQLASTQFSNSTVAAALQSAGSAGANGTSVGAASEAIRRRLHRLERFGDQISPFEALLIAAVPASQGGFELSQSQLTAFVSALMHD